MPAPLATPFPLKGSPFYSRISDQLTSTPVKNYYAIAFNPGFPLQASELNEVQEIFFLNSTLSNILPHSWTSTGYKIPSWNGLIPLFTNYIQITSNATGDIRGGFISISAGWYLWSDPTSKLRHWLYLDTNINESYVITAGDTRYFGLKVTKETITCCSSQDCTGKDADLQDNSSGYPGSYLTCGASRLKATIDTQIDVRNAYSDTTDWSLLFKIDTDPTTDAITAYYTDPDNPVKTTYS